MPCRILISSMSGHATLGLLFDRHMLVAINQQTTKPTNIPTMSLKQIQKKHPKIYKQIFQRGLAAQRTIEFAKENPDAPAICFLWGDEKHRDLIAKETAYLC
jgi:hypothetical protein